MIRSATITPNRLYRYVLDRQWADGQRCTFIMLNPSTADGDEDDPTIRRCIRFARDWGYGRLSVVNLFAYRATDPRDLRDNALAGIDIVGEANDDYIADVCDASALVVCAWGNHGAYMDRAREVLANIADDAICTPTALALTRAGHPAHPLYLKSTLQPFTFGAAAAAGEA